ncbi:MAG: Lrp/AsnC family transcriptional regulator [Gammaproteobacteria bacterium]|nr:Lrp/AsnC family transcriptional regulator [Gammaproteobacteria bacterium]
MPEAVLIHTIRQLLDDGTLSRFGPLYDAAKLGGAVTLAAMTVPEQRFEQVAGFVNSLPAVAHNYRREHGLNMWFVVASERPQGVAECLAMIESTTGLRVYDFPKLREFYLGLWLHIDGHGGVSTIPVPAESASPVAQSDQSSWKNIISATQAGLPLVTEPYRQLATQLGMPTTRLMDEMRAMLAGGVIRRIGAVPNHYRLGLRGNGMTVWDIPDDRVAELGALIGRQPFVSHCYERPRQPGIWPYNLFAMVHGCDRDEVLSKTARLRDLLGRSVRQSDVLFSSAVLKKAGLRVAA